MTMKRLLAVSVLCVSLVIVLGLAGCEMAGVIFDAGEELCRLYPNKCPIDPDLIEDLQLVAQDMTEAMNRSPQPGPYIVFEHPEAVGNRLATTAPFDLIVTFDRNQAPVDMASLSVRATKDEFSADLTPRLKPHIQGTAIRAEGLFVPDGNFRIAIEIADTNGEKTSQAYYLQVSSSPANSS